jgi:hypothetical protein
MQPRALSSVTIHRERIAITIPDERLARQCFSDPLEFGLDQCERRRTKVDPFAGPRLTPAAAPHRAYVGPTKCGERELNG